MPVMKKLQLFLLPLLVLLCATKNSFAQAGGVYTVAGGGTSTAEGVPATTARINTSSGIGVDHAGNIYLGEYGGCKVRMINASTGIIRTIAGTTCGFSGDGGPAATAQISAILGIWLDVSDNVYIADGGNNRIRKVDATTGIITTLAGGGSATADGVPATSASINPQCVFVDPSGCIYTGGDNRVRKIDPTTGIITTVAGNGAYGFSGDGGPATAASLSSYAKSIVMDDARNLYIIDFAGSRIRKVDAATGIITTVAGGGSYYVDGVPATSVSFSDFFNCGVDGAGNIFIADRSTGFIKRVDVATGIINTIAGSSSGSSVEGAPALSARVDPYMIYVDPVSNNIFYSNSSAKLRKFSYTPLVPFTGTTTTSGDSFTVSISPLCNGPELTSVTPHYIAGRSVKTDFGDGRTDSSVINPGFISGGYSITKHTYATAGTYTIRQTLYLGSTLVDTISYPYTYTFCRSLPVKIYYDVNANCIKDGTETFAGTPTITRVDSNGVPVDTISATSGFLYNAYSLPGDVYTFRLLSTPGNLTATCPSIGYIADTISSTVTTYPAKNFGLSCTTSSLFDLAETGIVPVTGMNDQWGNIYVRNNSCNPATGMLTLHFSPKYIYTGGARPAPTSASGNTISWDLGTLVSDGSRPTDIYYVVWHNPLTGYLTSGDTVQEHITISPIVGDGNTGNNTEIIIDTVKASCDPNEIVVSPAGCISSGVSATELTYTLHFENTGTDTAHNIYVMDTLSDFLDPSSLRIVMSTALMDIDIQKGSGHSVVKFDFPNIKLLDSSHHGECTGAVVYTINTKPGLPMGTHIYNYAGIYFDYNDAVMTNTADNEIGCPTTPLHAQTAKAHKADIYPNPATTELTIKTEDGAFSSYTISNSMGQVMLQQQLTTTITKIDVKALPAGLYYVTLKGEQGTGVKKFVKM